MSVYTDLASDYLQWEYVQTVVLTGRRRTGNTTDSIAYATTGSTRKTRQLFGEVALTGDEKTWVLPDTLLVQASDVQIGDVITEGSDITSATATKWKVQQVTRQKFDTEWWCFCIKQ